MVRNRIEDATGTATATDDPATTRILGIRRERVTQSRAFSLVNGHCGEILQLYRIHEGLPTVSVVTLPTPLFATRASVQLDRSGRITPVSGCLPAEELARGFFRELGAAPGVGACVEIESNVPTGKGCGSSTCLATSIAAACAAALGVPLPDEELQRMVQQVEGASDPLALIRHGQVVVYGSRTGDIQFRASSLPACQVVIVDTDPDGFFDTGACPGPEGATARDHEFADRTLWHFLQGVQFRDLEMVGEAAQMSAELHQDRVALNHFNELVGIRERFGAAGIAVAHSGTFASLLFRPDDPGRYDRMGDLRRAIEAIDCEMVGDYELNGV